MLSRPHFLDRESSINIRKKQRILHHRRTFIDHVVIHDVDGEFNEVWFTM